MVAEQTVEGADREDAVDGRFWWGTGHRCGTPDPGAFMGSVPILIHVQL